ncbi:MAG TPA: hypothetical protein VFY26_20855, partial [Anaerolineales bacterium]|nr:hypothetical protein [Anaerolineales bacterium]
RGEKGLLYLWLAINLIIGILTVHQYGMSIDEPNNYRYANDTLNAYPSLFGILYEPKLDSSYEGHGPAFVALAALLVRVVQGIFPTVFAPDIWHLTYFITFLMTGLCLYWLTRRWFGRWTAWGVLLLFNTQPVLLGHAFMNPKDIPFMFFFTLSIVMGLRLSDRSQASDSSASLAEPIRRLYHRYQGSDARRRQKFRSQLIVTVSAALILFLFSSPIQSSIVQAVTSFHSAGPDTWAGQVFSSIASQASSTSAEQYVIKALTWLTWITRFFLTIGILYFSMYFSLLLANTDLPILLRNIWRRRDRLSAFLPGLARSLQHVKPGSIRSWLAEFTFSLRNPHILLAGIVLGLATSMRAIAPLAGLIAVLFLLTKIRSRGWAQATAYFLVAAVTTYLAWPYLWASPIVNYLKEVGIITSFQHYSGRVLFAGELHGIRDLPPTYLPVLLSIQFTEPLVLGILTGIGVLVWRLLRTGLRTDLLLYVGMGFIFPLVTLSLLNTPLYHNFRQVLFIVPAMFMLAAFSLDVMFTKVIYPAARLLVIAALMLPGISSTVKLYPYEYVYYNSLVGGPAGVLNRYELDYWRTSMRELALKLNEVAPEASKIVISGSASLFNHYARPDLIVETVAQSTYDLDGGYDYAVQLARWRNWEIYPQARTIFVIERDGVVLATVKAVKDASLK